MFELFLISYILNRIIIPAACISIAQFLSLKKKLLARNIAFYFFWFFLKITHWNDCSNMKFSDTRETYNESVFWVWKSCFSFHLARGLFLDNYFGEQSYHSQQGWFTNFDLAKFLHAVLIGYEKTYFTRILNSPKLTLRSWRNGVLGTWHADIPHWYIIFFIYK
jgi:hypothetical protein